jgi:Helix-hairpin-helix domain
MTSSPPPFDLPQNAGLAARLRDFAELLRQQEADGFRTAAYNHAADTIEKLDRPIAAIFTTKGREGLVALPSIGQSIASALVEMLTTGRWAQLERLRGTLEPDKQFQTIAGIGPELARNIHDELHVETLEALETAAQDGRLAGVKGIGPRRLRMISAALAEQLGRPRLRRQLPRLPEPPVAILLDVDREYREGAKAGQLKKIAPKRFNPTGEAWLPIMHTRRDAWRFTALYSNSRLAHELDRLNDWVLVFFEADTTPEGQCTIVTAMQGPLRGRRIVRGREDECQDHYAKLDLASPMRSAGAPIALERSMGR